MDVVLLDKSKFLSIGLIFTLSFSLGASATVIKNTVVTGTKVTQGNNKAGANVEQNPSYNRSPVTDAELERAVKLETVKINRLFQSSITNVLANSSEYGDPKMEVLMQNNANSKDIHSVIDIDRQITGENRKREIEEYIAQEKYKEGAMTKEQLDAQVLRTVFPVQTGMKPTKLPSRKINLSEEARNALVQPMAVIGSDEYSIAWFKTNLGVIRRLKAAVVITEVKNLTDLQAITSFAPDLMYQPMDAKQFLQVLGISTYPILLTSEGALQ